MSIDAAVSPSSLLSALNDNNNNNRQCLYLGIYGGWAHVCWSGAGVESCLDLASGGGIIWALVVVV
jgi:hypothetical protein